MFFKNVLKKRIKNEKGLTLIELLAVIVILAIVAAIAIPAIGNIINNSRDKAVLSDVQAAISSAKIEKADGGCPEVSGIPTCTLTDLEFTSDKLSAITIEWKPATTGTGAKPAHILVTATLTEKMKGKKIPEAIKGTDGSSLTDKSLVITDSGLNKVLD